MTALLPCKAVREEPYPRSRTARTRAETHPTCNRWHGHDGDHWEAVCDRSGFHYRATWTEAECQRQPINGGLPLSIFDWQDG